MIRSAFLSMCLALVLSPSLLFAQQTGEDLAGAAAGAGGCLACGGFLIFIVESKATGGLLLLHGRASDHAPECQLLAGLTAAVYLVAECTRHACAAQLVGHPSGGKPGFEVVKTRLNQDSACLS